MKTWLLLVQLGVVNIPVPNIQTEQDCERLGMAITKDLSLPGNYKCYGYKQQTWSLFSAAEEEDAKRRRTKR